MKFFEKLFWLADTSIEVILRILFLSFGNTDIKFVEKPKKSIWRSYTAAKTLSIPNRIELINKSKFVKVTLNENFKIFIIYVATLELSVAMFIYPYRATQVVIL